MKQEPYLAGSTLIVSLAKLSMKVPFIKDQEFVAACCLENTMLAAGLECAQTRDEFKQRIWELVQFYVEMPCTTSKASVALE